MLEKNKKAMRKQHRFSHVGFGKRFKELLKEGAKKELLKKLNLTDNALRQWTNGHTLPSTENLIQIAEFFNVSIDYLLGMRKEKTANAKIQAIVDTLGLTETAIYKIIDFGKDENINCENICTDLDVFCNTINGCTADDTMAIRRIDILNYVLAHDGFKKLIQSIGVYLHTYSNIFDKHVVQNYISSKRYTFTKENVKINKVILNEEEVGKLIVDKILDVYDEPSAFLGGHLYTANEHLSQIAFDIAKQILPSRIIKQRQKIEKD